jgi:hypothetical protein
MISPIFASKFVNLHHREGEKIFFYANRLHNWNVPLLPS